VGKKKENTEVRNYIVCSICNTQIQIPLETCEINKMNICCQGEYSYAKIKLLQGKSGIYKHKIYDINKKNANYSYIIDTATKEKLKVINEKLTYFKKGY